TVTARTTRTTLIFTRSSSHFSRHFAVWQQITFVDPDFDTNNTVGRLCFRGAVIDDGAQGVQRHTTFTIPFGTGNFDTVQPAGGHDLDALRTQAHGVLHRAFHGATEHDPFFQLLSDRISDQLSIGFRLANFFDINVNRHAHQALQV